MSEEPLAHKNQPPDVEYDSIYATMAETAQGRRFLEEHARRSAPPELAAIQRMQAAVADETGVRLDLFLLEVAEMAQAIARTRAEIAAIQPPPQRPGQIDATTEELDSIVQTTESATSRILAAAEKVQELAWRLRENGIDENFCNQLDALATEIYTACTFQDVTGQRTRKVIHVLRYLEGRINAMVDIWGKDAAEQKSEQAADEPCIAGSLGQADVDAVMQPDAPAVEEDRQDATLEDINRFMLALEPLMALHQAAAAPIEEVRPELSVSATVMQEAEDAQALAEWVTDGAPPDMQALPAQAETMPSPAEPAAVEQPAQARAAEPAWMALQRLQTTPDFPQPEPEAEAELSEPAGESEPIIAAAAPEEFVAPPPPPAAAAPERAETTKPLPILSVATPQDEIIARLTAMLPPAELNFPRALAKAADIAVPVAAPEPQITSPVVELPPATTREEATFAAAPDFDTDEFLFAPETAEEAEPIAQSKAREDEAPADFLLVPAPPQVVLASTVLPPKAKLVARAPYDPLAPLRALSDEEKIALFS